MGGCFIISFTFPEISFIIFLIQQINEIKLAHFGLHGAALKRAFIGSAQQYGVTVSSQGRFFKMGNTGNAGAGLLCHLGYMDIVLGRPGIGNNHNQIFLAAEGGRHGLHMG